MPPDLFTFDEAPMAAIQLSLVVPCYNEEEVLPETARQLLALLDRLVQERVVNDQSTVTFVDDGSRDRT